MTKYHKWLLRAAVIFGIAACFATVIILSELILKLK